METYPNVTIDNFNVKISVCAKPRLTKTSIYRRCYYVSKFVEINDNLRRASFFFACNFSVFTNFINTECFSCNLQPLLKLLTLVEVLFEQ